jgi:hypothetical protein
MGSQSGVFGLTMDRKGAVPLNHVHTRRLPLEAGEMYSTALCILWSCEWCSTMLNSRGEWIYTTCSSCPHESGGMGKNCPMTTDGKSNTYGR